MDFPILSIIVPSYNTSKYVDECLPTFIDERLFGKVKIYLIDDGATDDTALKIKPFVDKYPLLFEFHHKENGGHGSVINYGVYNLVKTKYFKVVDGDDWVNTDNLVSLVNYLYETDDDLIVNDYVKNFVDETKCRVCCKKGSSKSPLLSDLVLSIHSVTFKTSLFVMNNIVIREHIFYDDNEYVLFPLQHVTNYKYLSYDVYEYRIGSLPQSVNPLNLIKNYSHLQIVENDLINMYKDIMKNDANNIALSQYDKSLFFLFLNDYIFALHDSTSKKEFNLKYGLLEKRKSEFPSIYSKISKNKKYVFLRCKNLIPFKLLKFIFKNRFS